MIEEEECNEEKEEMEVLKAQTVYLLMKKNYRISRNVRAQWLLEHLHEKVKIQDTDENEELKLISVVPLEPPIEWSTATCRQYQYEITPTTIVIFLADKYRMVFCLDISPSLSAVDVQYGEVMIHLMFKSLKESLNGLTRRFIVPGSNYIFAADIYVTIIAHTPFFTSPAQQVLVQGWHLNKDTLPQLITLLAQQIRELEFRVAQVSGIAQEHLEAIRDENEKLVGGLFEESIKSITSSENPMVTPDVGFINMLRFGMLAQKFLPESSSANIVIFTDGIINIPDIHVFDSVLSQLRSSMIACSFIQVSGAYDPNCCKGFVPYTELMKFLADATLGSYIASTPAWEVDDVLRMNLYHSAFLTWSLQYRMKIFCPKPSTFNKFTFKKDIITVRKKHLESTLNTTLQHVFWCRLREGYTIKHVKQLEGTDIEICLLLTWKNDVYIEYCINSTWPPSSPVHYTVIIEAPYEFLHDITCRMKKPFQSPFREAVVGKFWSTLKKLNETDQLLVHIHSFYTNTASYTLPDSIKNGMPLFYIPPNTNMPVLSLGDSPFSMYWKPVSLLDTAVWHKWLHPHRFTFLLQHDRPLPKYLHQANPSGRFQQVQCRQAAVVLYSIMKEWCTFVLIENHSYVKLIQNDIENAPISFLLLRVNSKLPCVVIDLAFLGGASGTLRSQIVNDLKNKFSTVILPQRPLTNETIIRKVTAIVNPKIAIEENITGDLNCCIVFTKPVEKILIRYEKMPSDFTTIIFPDGTQPLAGTRAVSQAFKSSGMLTTLSRYLHHRRWIWIVKKGNGANIPASTLQRTLSTITKTRLREGFHFAHSTAGIINMVLEVQMQASDSDSTTHSCVIQYVLFPPNLINKKESGSDEECNEDLENVEFQGDIELISECWIEPQYGRVVSSPNERGYMNGLTYDQLAEEMCKVDSECIFSIITFEHLTILNNIDGKLLCVPPYKSTLNPAKNKEKALSPYSLMLKHEQRINHMPSLFDVVTMLPKCQQAEILLPIFIQDISKTFVDKCNFYEHLDVPNKYLLEMIYNNLLNLHGNELLLSPEDSKQFVEQLMKRQRNDKVPYPVPIPTLNDEKRVKFAKWRCYFKKNDVNNLILTFVPATLDDLKLLMINEEAMNGFESKSVKIIEVKDNEKVIEESQTKIEQENGDGGELSDNQSDVSDNSVKLSSSVQNIDMITFPRVRANSLDTAAKRPNIAEIRRRTRTASMDSRNKKKYSLQPLNSRHLDIIPKYDHKKIFAAITLPIYVYHCSLTSLLDNIIYKDNSKYINDLFIDQTEPTEQEVKPPNNAEILLLHEQCKKIDEFYKRCFVLSLFKSLQNSAFIHNIDLTIALKECISTEVKIDITLYIQAVCAHLKESLIKRNIMEIFHENSENNLLESKFDLRVFDHQEICSKMNSIHNIIKYQFLIILKNNFNDVFSNNEYFYCAKSSKQQRPECIPVIQPYFKHSIDAFHLDPRLMASLKGSQCWERDSETTIDTSGSASDLHDEDSADELSPLFLHFICTLNINNKIYSQAVSGLPTCLGEFESCLNSEEPIIDLSSFKTYFNIQCLTLPIIEHLDKHINDSGNLNDSNNTDTQVDIIQEIKYEDSFTRLIEHLPYSQHKAIIYTRHEIEWLIKDETASFLLDIYPVAETTLNFVTEHIISSHGRSSCLVEAVPLNFVYGTTNSLEKFIQIFSTLCIDRCFYLRKSGSYYYIVQDYSKRIKMKRKSRRPTGGSTNDEWSLIDKKDSDTMSDVAQTEDSFLKSESSDMERERKISSETIGTPDLIIDLQDIDSPNLEFMNKEPMECLTDKRVKNPSGKSDGERSRHRSSALSTTGADGERSRHRSSTLPTTGADGERSRHRSSTLPTTSADGERSRKYSSTLPTTSADGERSRKYSSTLPTTSADGERSRKYSSTLPTTGADGERSRHHSSTLPTTSADGERSRQYPSTLSTTGADGERSRHHSSTLPTTSADGERSRQYLSTLSTTCADGERSRHRSSTLPTTSADGERSRKYSSTLPTTGADGERSRQYSSTLSTTGADGERSRQCSSTLSTTGADSEIASFLDQEGYDGDSSDDDNSNSDSADESRISLPPFWIVMFIKNDHVMTYSHCRLTGSVERDTELYSKTRISIIKKIFSTCKLVNQICLLQNLHNTRICDDLLEAENSSDCWKDSEGNTKSDEEIIQFKPGCFACNVVWETQFFLHPRLKTGSAKRGIQALRTVLNHLSVSNRKNMFVYQDNSGNVFYLRLQEFVPVVINNKLTPPQSKTSDGDVTPPTVARSPSISSIRRTPTDEISPIKLEPRPRVKSFGEKDGDNFRPEDAVVLKVHGISCAGSEIKNELVEALQKRLADAVLDLLSNMLFRNPMCMLSPDDVHFLQRPNQQQNDLLKVSIQSYVQDNLSALMHYLKQNLLQFLHIPKYTDPRTEHHFQDYSKPFDSTERVKEDDIYLYNQTAASGNRGMACIAMAIVDLNGKIIKQYCYDKPVIENPSELIYASDFNTLTSCPLYNTEENVTHVEFRIWTQGRVNIDLLYKKLQSAVQHSTWDLIMEYYLLLPPLAIDIPPPFPLIPNEKFIKGEYDPFECGEEGQLHPLYQEFLSKWLNFAVEIGVPSIKKHCIQFKSRQSISISLKELQRLLIITAPDTTFATFKIINKDDKQYYIPHCVAPTFQDQSRWDDASNSATYFLIGRNMNLWKSSLLTTISDPEILFPRALKLCQKFAPFITACDSEENTTTKYNFIPRQRLLLVTLSEVEVSLITYNWSKDRCENVCNQVSNLGQWLVSRSALLSSIVCQKLGIFQNQPYNRQVMYVRKGVIDQARLSIMEIEQLLKSPSAGAKETAIGRRVTTIPTVCMPDAFRDMKPLKTITKINVNSDPLVSNGQQIMELFSSDKKESRRKLEQLWQMRVTSPNIPVSEDIIQLLKQQSRVIHFCLTPLLFSPGWRIQSAATRDHNLAPTSGTQRLDLQQMKSFSQFQSGSEGSDRSIRSTGSLQSSPAGTKRFPEDQWHQSLCSNFTQEYKKYLQTLGFIPIQVDLNSPKKTSVVTKPITPVKDERERQRKLSGPAILSSTPSSSPTSTSTTPFLRRRREDCHYLQKSLLGGILIFELVFNEPFFQAKLHAVEFNRLQNKNSVALLTQFTFSFLDETDKIKILMHLHSYTYDYHLRTIHKYISNQQTELRKNFHIRNFIDNFLKYYSKGPNFARNIVYSDSIIVKNTCTPAQQLFNYLRSHEDLYQMEVICMTQESDFSNASENEYILVQLKNAHHVSYKDSQDVKQTDDFDITLIVALENSENILNTLHLKYYIILTSRREHFPKQVVDRKLGKFVNVPLPSELSTDIVEYDNCNLEQLQQELEREEAENIESENELVKDENIDEEDNKTVCDLVLPPQIEIRQEAVNYMGYYSSHEQSMQQLVMKQAKTVREQILKIVEQGMVHCRTHVLWESLFSTQNKTSRRDLCFDEFCELLKLASIESLATVDQRLGPLMCQSIPWYQSLDKLFSTKYSSDVIRRYTSADNSVQHTVILSNTYKEAFTLLSIDLIAPRGELAIVYKRTPKSTDADFNINYNYKLISPDFQILVESFINVCCFHLWANLL